MPLFYLALQKVQRKFTVFTKSLYVPICSLHLLYSTCVKIFTSLGNDFKGGMLMLLDFIMLAMLLGGFGTLILFIDWNEKQIHK